jgi:adenylate cyclase
MLLAQTLQALSREKKESEGAYRRSLKVTRKHLDLNPDDARAVLFGASALAHLGDREEAVKWASRASVIDPDNPSVNYNVACVFAQLNEVDRGIDSLEQSITTGMAQKEWMENDPDLNPLRQHPRFQVLLDRLDKSD